MIIEDMKKEYRINNSKITVSLGDILDSRAEVIVSSDDFLLSMGGGISKAIKIAAGEELVSDARKKVPASLGDIVVTTAGKLPQKFVFHAVTIGFDMRGNEDLIEDVHQFIVQHAIKQAFRIMSSIGLTSIAFPAIGAGAAQIPIKKVADSMAAAFSEILSLTNRPFDVELHLKSRNKDSDNWEFLPFFEALACVEKDASQTRLKSLEVIDSKDYSDVVVKDVKSLKEGKHKVFISYSRHDSSAILPICDVLNQIQVPYWIDIDGTYSGANYKQVVIEAIEQASIVLFVSSENSNKSDNVAKEINLADKLKKTIIPLRIDLSPYDKRIEYDLVGIDYIDFTFNTEEALNKLRLSVLGRLAMQQE